MLEALPGWVVDDVASVRREVAEWKGLTEAERWGLAKLCARDVVWAIRAGGHSAKALEHADALPESSKAALARLRREAGWPRDAP